MGFRPEPDDDAVLAVFRRTAEGSLDAETRKNVRRRGAEETTRHELEFYLDCPGEREWWRLARWPPPSSGPGNRNTQTRMVLSVP